MQLNTSPADILVHVVESRAAQSSHPAIELLIYVFTGQMATRVERW